jgi:hypothetical protein
MNCFLLLSSIKEVPILIKSLFMFCPYVFIYLLFLLNSYIKLFHYLLNT